MIWFAGYSCCCGWCGNTTEKAFTAVDQTRPVVVSVTTTTHTSKRVPGLGCTIIAFVGEVDVCLCASCQK